MRKSDVQYRNGCACVNIKVYALRGIDSAVRAARAGDCVPEGLTAEWIEENLSDDALDALFWRCCEYEYEYFEEWAREIMPGTRFHVEGRQGGWAKVCRSARAIADDIPAQMVYSIEHNEYAAHEAELEQAELLCGSVAVV